MFNEIYIAYIFFIENICLLFVSLKVDLKKALKILQDKYLMPFTFKSIFFLKVKYLTKESYPPNKFIFKDHLQEAHGMPDFLPTIIEVVTISSQPTAN